MKTASLVMTLWAFAFSVCAFSARAEGSVAASEGVQPESGEGNNGQHAVLLLSSYHPGFPTFFDQVEGVQSVLNTPAIQLDIEFMDSKRFNRRQLNDIFYANLKRKLNRLPGYDLIIAADDAATHFAVEHQSELFNDAPIVFFGVNDMAYAKSLAGRPNVTGIMERAAIKETVELINSLFRQHEVVVITDGSFTANSDTKRFKEEMAAMGFDRFRVVSLEDLSFEEMFSEIRNLPSNSGILLISLFRDRAGEVREFKRTLRDIRRATSVPIFHLWYHGLGEGVLGGKLLSHRTQAEAAAKIGLKILKGENDQQPWDIMDTPTEYVFDYNELSRHKIALDRLPEEAIIVNAPDPLLQRYRSYFLGFAVFVLLLGVVIVVLMLNIRARRRHEEEITRLNEELEEKVSERTAALREAHFEVAKVLRFQDSILDNSVVSIVFVRQSRIEWLNRYTEQMLGYNADEIIGREPDFLFLDSDDAEKVRREVPEQLRRGEHYQAEFPFRRKDDEVLWGMVCVRAIKPGDLEEGLLLIVVDISDRKQAEEQLKVLNTRLETQATTDHLTGLSNRRQMMNLIEQEIHQADRYQTVFSVIMVDVDYFKALNDRYGHLAGDEVLKAIANVLTHASRQTDTVARWGGEEFLILCPFTQSKDAFTMAESLRGKLQNTDFGIPEQVTASFGLAPYKRGQNLESLVQEADNALYNAKVFRNCVCAS